MSKYTVPNEKEKRIIRQNLLDPEKVAVMYSDETKIRLLCYPTRDVIVIEKGDRKWL